MSSRRKVGRGTSLANEHLVEEVSGTPTRTSGRNTVVEVNDNIGTTNVSKSRRSRVEPIFDPVSHHYHCIHCTFVSNTRSECAFHMREDHKGNSSSTVTSPSCPKSVGRPKGSGKIRSNAAIVQTKTENNQKKTPRKKSVSRRNIAANKKDYEPPLLEAVVGENEPIETEEITILDDTSIIENGMDVEEDVDVMALDEEAGDVVEEVIEDTEIESNVLHPVEEIVEQEEVEEYGRSELATCVEEEVLPEVPDVQSIVTIGGEDDQRTQEDKTENDLRYSYQETSYDYEQVVEDNNKAVKDNEPLNRFPLMRKRGRPRKNPSEGPPPTSKIRISDPSGKYACYMPHCNWRGGYRSLRADHMKFIHPEWKQPPRFLLQRITKDGIYIDPKSFVPEFNCFLEGCPWKGNFRASRSVHMRTHHPNFTWPNKRASSGGYQPFGAYSCLVEGCGWRGASRSTRSSHLRRVHPGYVNPGYLPRSVQCSDCVSSFSSHKVLVDHMVATHRTGGIVQRDFTSVTDYEEWFDAVQEAFSVEFIKRMGVRNTPMYQVLYLYCAQSGSYRSRTIRSRRYTPLYARSRSLRTRCGKSCAVFLRIVHWNDGRLTVVGCVEHTGHRMGTSLLRSSPSEREVMDHYLYVEPDTTPIECMVDRLREQDGFVIDGYELKDRKREQVERYILHSDELISLVRLTRSNDMFPPDSTFNTNMTSQNLLLDGEICSSPFTFGFQTAEMRELWIKHSSKACCFEEVRLLISSWDLVLVIVLVFDETEAVRVAALYLTQSGDRLPLLNHLRQLTGTPLETVVTTANEVWPDLIEQVFGDLGYDTDLQIGEWHIISEWAMMCDQMIDNRVDRFTVLCALRRWLRTTDVNLFDSIVVDLFEALREMELDEVAEFIDGQLTDPAYAKRWTPMNRNPLTENSNPTLEIACRTLRERYLNCTLCSRLDEYLGLLFERVQEFNLCKVSTVYATKDPEPPRVVPDLYDHIDPSDVLADGTVAMNVDVMENDDEIADHQDHVHMSMRHHNENYSRNHHDMDDMMAIQGSSKMEYMMMDDQIVLVDEQGMVLQEVIEEMDEPVEEQVIESETIEEERRPIPDSSHTIHNSVPFRPQPQVIQITRHAANQEIAAAPAMAVKKEEVV